VKESRSPIAKPDCTEQTAILDLYFFAQGLQTEHAGPKEYHGVRVPLPSQHRVPGTSLRLLTGESESLLRPDLPLSCLYLIYCVKDAKRA